MPLTFEMYGSKSFSLSPLAEEMTVSRINVPRSRNEELAQRPLPRRLGRDIMYGPTPIERTMRQRQLLCSLSDPSLRGRVADAVEVTGSSPSGCRSAQTSASVSRSAPLTAAGLNGASLPAAASWPVASWAPSAPAVTMLNVGVRKQAPLRCVEACPSSPLGRNWKGLASPTGEAWYGLLSGSRSVDLPFESLEEGHVKEICSRFGQGILLKNPDCFARWYREQEAARTYFESESRRPSPPEGALLPWNSERDNVMQNLASMGRDLTGGDPATGHRLYLRRLAALYEHLHSLGPLQGPNAIGVGMKYRIGNERSAVKFVDFDGKGRVGLLEFSGVMGILGFDVEKLAGVTLSELLLRMDPLREGSGRLNDFLHLAFRRKWQASPTRESLEAGVKPPPPIPLNWYETAHLAQNVDPSVVAARERWVAIARWMGIVCLRSSALREERRCRGWQISQAGSPEHAPFEGDEGERSTLESVVKRREEADLDRREQASGSGGQDEAALAVVTQVLLETAAAIREEEHKLREIFHVSSSIRLPDGPQLLARTDLHLLFSELAKVDTTRELSEDSLDKLYDNAVQLQCKLTKIGTGLSFWSLKALLSDVGKMLGLAAGWQSLSNLLLDRAKLAVS